MADAVFNPFAPMAPDGVEHSGPGVAGANPLYMAATTVAKTLNNMAKEQAVIEASDTMGAIMGDPRYGEMFKQQGILALRSGASPDKIAESQLAMVGRMASSFLNMTEAQERHRMELAETAASQSMMEAVSDRQTSNRIRGDAASLAGQKSLARLQASLREPGTTLSQAQWDLLTPEQQESYRAYLLAQRGSKTAAEEERIRSIYPAAMITASENKLREQELMAAAMEATSQNQLDAKKLVAAAMSDQASNNLLAKQAIARAMAIQQKGGGKGTGPDFTPNPDAPVPPVPAGLSESEIRGLFGE